MTLLCFLVLGIIGDSWALGMCDDITPQRHQYYGGYGHDEMILWMCSGDEQGGAPAIQYGVVGVVALVGAGLNLLCVKNIAGPASDEVQLKKEMRAQQVKIVGRCVLLFLVVLMMIFYHYICIKWFAVMD